MSAITINTNIASMNAQRNIVGTQQGLDTAMARLSSGLRIVHASDDAAGLAISEKLRAHVRGLAQAQRNSNDGVSMLQTAEGALGEIDEMLIRMRELAIQSGNGTLGAAQRVSLNDEFKALRSEIDRVATVTEFNGTKLIDGSLSGGVTFQIGINGTANDRITLSLTGSGSTAIGVTAGTTVSTVTGAQNVLGIIDTAISSVTSRRGTIGAAQNRLMTTIASLGISQENLAAAESRIRDADVAAESANLAKSQILMQAGVAMLAQANQLPSLALSLIK